LRGKSAIRGGCTHAGASDGFDNRLRRDQTSDGLDAPHAVVPHVGKVEIPANIEGEPARVENSCA
jgi:hypothetical protein